MGKSLHGERHAGSRQGVYLRQQDPKQKCPCRSTPSSEARHSRELQTRMTLSSKEQRKEQTDNNRTDGDSLVSDTHHVVGRHFRRARKHEWYVVGSCESPIGAPNIC